VIVIDITGGLPDGAVVATIGNAVLVPEAGEVIEDFRVRAREAALEVGSDWIVFGGMPSLTWIDEGASAGASNEGVDEDEPD
jgi:hypothetical protein